MQHCLGPVVSFDASEFTGASPLTFTLVQRWQLGSLAAWQLGSLAAWQLVVGLEVQWFAISSEGSRIPKRPGTP